jgi:hypothetical protein
MMPYYLDKSPRPTYQIRASSNARTLAKQYVKVQ